jgi:hypothetical protein
MNGQPVAEKPVGVGRTDSSASVAVLIGGTILAVAVFAASFVLRLVGYVDLGDSVGAGGVVVLLATPAAALITTTIELRRGHRPHWALALVVLGILAGATVLALLTSN